MWKRIKAIHTNFLELCFFRLLNGSLSAQEIEAFGVPYRTWKDAQYRMLTPGENEEVKLAEKKAFEELCAAVGDLERFLRIPTAVHWLMVFVERMRQGGISTQRISKITGLKPAIVVKMLEEAAKGKKS